MLPTGISKFNRVGKVNSNKANSNSRSKAKHKNRGNPIRFLLITVLLLIIAGTLYYFSAYLLPLTEEQKKQLTALQICSSDTSKSQNHDFSDLTQHDFHDEYLNLFEECSKSIERNYAEAKEMLDENNDLNSNLVTEHQNQLEKAKIELEKADYKNFNQQSYSIISIFPKSLDSKSILTYHSKSTEELENVKDFIEQERAKKDNCLNSPDFDNCFCTETINIDEFLQNLPIETKVAQLLGPAYTYNRIKDNSVTKEDFGSYVLLQTTSYSGYDELAQDVSSLKDGNTIPPFIGIDAEGGSVKRFYWHEFTQLSTQVGQSEEQLCNNLSSDIDFFNRSGMNWSLGPVVDLPANSSDWISDRAISYDVETIISTSRGYINCFKNNKILTSAKHFPGHGFTTTDSHIDIPQVLLSQNEWENSSQKIYAELIKSGVDSIMIGHLQYPSISSETSSLSDYWMTETLKERMGYQGLLVTDDIAMLHPYSSANCTDLIITAIENGIDIALFSDYYNCDGNEVKKTLINKAFADSNFAKKINQNATKILHAKKEYLCEF